jgi:hypothetical protein
MGEDEPCTTWGAGQSPEPYMVQGVGVDKKWSEFLFLTAARGFYAIEIIDHFSCHFF